jgi:hypothetical protein
MAYRRSHATSVGLVGLFCLVIMWTARFAPDLADTYAYSSFGKFVVALGAPVLGIILTAVAAIKGSRWWLVVVATGVISWVELFLRLSQRRI